MTWRQSAGVRSISTSEASQRLDAEDLKKKENLYLSINPNYVTGFSDGEATFCISILKNPNIYHQSSYRQNLKPIIYINKRNFSTSSKVNSVFNDWPHIQSIIKILSDKEEKKPDLWECDYSFLTSAILPYYFHISSHTTWIVTPEFNHTEGNLADYTIFLWSNDGRDYTRMVHAVMELKSRAGDSWYKLLEQMWSQADRAKNQSGRLWAIGQKGLEICFFRFDV